MDDLAHVLRACRLEVPRTAPVDLGSPARTHVFVVGELVVKFDDESRVGAASMVREAQALTLLQSTDLPVPRIVAAGEFPDTRRWVVLTRLRGAAPAPSGGALDSRRVRRGAFPTRKPTVRRSACGRPTVRRSAA